MRTFGFQGFMESSAVALSIYQNGQTRGVSVPAWGVSASATVEIDVSLPQTLVAPSQVWVKAINTTGLADFTLTGAVYQAAFHEYHYVWTINGEPLQGWNAPQNMIPDWNNPNRANGQEVGFCLTDPGPYTIELLVIDRLGNTAVAVTDEITVIAANAQYPDTDTICFSVDGIFTDKPENAEEITTLAALESHLTTRNTSNTRVLFRRGETYDDVSLLLEGRQQCTYIGAFGPLEDKPVIRPPFRNMDADACIAFQDHFQTPELAKTITVTGVKFQADWDATSESGHLGLNRTLSVRSSKYENAHFMFHDLEFEGVNIGLNLGPSVRSYDTFNRYIVADCVFTGWKDYGIFAYQLPGDKIAVIGNRITQHVDALNGGEKTVGFMNNHGPVRIADVTGAYIAMNDIFSRSGWTGLDQQCLRLSTSAAPGQWNIVNRNVMEGGYLMVSLEGQNTGEDDVPGNHLIDGNLMISTAVNSLSFVSVHRGGTTVRGNYGYTPANLYVQTAGAAQAAFSFNPNNSQDGNTAEPVVLYSNTVLIERDNVQANDVTYSMSQFEEFETFVDENNVFHLPNRVPAITASAPMATSQTIPGIVLRYKGLRVGFEPVTFTMPGAVAEGETLFLPYADFHQRLAAKPGSPDKIELGGPTDQTYWQSLALSDMRHALAVPGVGLMGAHLGHFTVSFADPTHMIITNTSGETWGLEGLDITLKMHRHSKVPEMDTSFGHDGQSVPLAVPGDDQSAAWQSATGAFVTPHSFIEADPRPTPIHQGAL